MLGYCGINCDNCPAYKGTVNNNMFLLGKAASSFCRGEYSAKDWVCLGCMCTDQSFTAVFCTVCGIRKCAVERGIQNCAACTHFEKCELLHNFIYSESDEFIRSVHLLRQHFLDMQKLNTQD